MTKTKKLPDNPADLIRLAVADLVAAGDDTDNYRINMLVWHAGIGPDNGNRCVVCLAGSVMAKTLNASKRKNLIPGSFDTDTELKLLALDEFRTGNIASAYVLLGRPMPLCLNAYAGIEGYMGGESPSRDRFIADMLDLAAAIDLAEAKAAKKESGDNA